MRLKSFYGPTMTDVMRSVREALGDGAIIVATRDDEMGGVRVTAAIEDSGLSAPQASAQTAAQDADQDGSACIEIVAKALLSHQTPNDLAEKLLATATQFASEDPLLALGAALDTHFKFDPLPDDAPAAPIMFIGPPGAGKTLCAAKFATKATLAKKTVAIIGTDTQRAGGMAQLAAFTRLLQKDMLETEDAHALRDAVAIQKPGTFVYIDTAGCNPFSAAEREALSALIKASGAVPILVLPADLDQTVAVEMAKEFAALGAKRLLPTRLDMARRCGTLMRAAFESRLPLCHFSATSNVTQPPQPMNPVSLARLVLPKAESGKEKVEERKRAFS